jgi:signal transduction histidine kinase
MPSAITIKIGHHNISFGTHDDDYYRFEVADNGMGIAPQYHEKIFGNNFTLKITDSFNKKGSGIGLSTVNELIKALMVPSG